MYACMYLCMCPYMFSQEERKVFNTKKEKSSGLSSSSSSSSLPVDTNDDNHADTLSRIGVNINVDDDEQWNILGIDIHVLIHTYALSYICPYIYMLIYAYAHTYICSYIHML